MEGEEFESFFMVVQQIVENADLFEDHLEECRKNCWDLALGTRIVNGVAMEKNSNIFSFNIR